MNKHTDPIMIPAYAGFTIWSKPSNVDNSEPNTFYVTYSGAVIAWLLYREEVTPITQSGVYKPLDGHVTWIRDPNGEIESYGKYESYSIHTEAHINKTLRDMQNQ